VSASPSDQPEAGAPPVEPTGPIGGRLEPTGQPDVDAALERLRDVDAMPVADHVVVYDEVQQRLAAVMGDAQDRPPTGPG